MLVSQVVQVCTESCGMKSFKRKNVSVPARGAGVHAQRVCACIGTAVQAQRVCECSGRVACNGTGVHAQTREFVPAVVQECMLRECACCGQGYPVRLFESGADVYSEFVPAKFVSAVV